MLRRSSILLSRGKISGRKEFLICAARFSFDNFLGVSRDSGVRQFSSTTASTFSGSDSTHKNTDAYVSGSETHFGFRNVNVNEKEKLVKEVFASVADSYDVMNDLMSCGIHRCWKDELISMTSISSLVKLIRQQQSNSSENTATSASSPPCMKILDVAGGTGDIAFRFIDAAGCVERAKSSGKDEVSVTVVDINPDMLRVGEQRARQRYGNALMETSGALSFKEGNAQNLCQFDDNTFDIYTIAFGLRNVTDVDTALREAYRVLKPGGRYMCLEFSKVNNAAFRAIYDAYSFNVIPKVRHELLGDKGQC